MGGAGGARAAGLRGSAGRLRGSAGRRCSSSLSSVRIGVPEQHERTLWRGRLHWRGGICRRGQVARLRVGPLGTAVHALRWRRAGAESLEHDRADTHCVSKTSGREMRRRPRHSDLTREKPNAMARARRAVVRSRVQDDTLHRTDQQPPPSPRPAPPRAKEPPRAALPSGGSRVLGGAL